MLCIWVDMYYSVGLPKRGCGYLQNRGAKDTHKRTGQRALSYWQSCDFSRPTQRLPRKQTTSGAWQSLMRLLNPWCSVLTFVLNFTFQNVFWKNIGDLSWGWGLRGRRQQNNRKKHSSTGTTCHSFIANCFTLPTQNHSLSCCFCNCRI